MKTILFIFALITSLAADEFRTWTQAESDKKIEAKILDKNDGKVQLSTKDGKEYWLDVAKLIQEDQKFIATWRKKPLGFEHLSVSVTGKPREGQMSISVDAKTWEKGVKMVVYYEKGINRLLCRTEIEPYNSHSWKGTVSNKYHITLVDSDGNIVSQLSEGSKE